MPEELVLFSLHFIILWHYNTRLSKLHSGLVIDEGSDDIRSSATDTANYFASGSRLNVRLDPVTQIANQDDVLQYIIKCRYTEKDVFAPLVRQIQT